jgi:Ni,Fe-hydrogenase III component G
MTRIDILQNLKEKFNADILDVFDKTPKRVYVDIRPEAVVRMCRHIFSDLGARFNIASGVDARDHMEILYHFTFDDINLVISLRVKLDKSKLEIDSISSLFEGANWIEREIHEVLGIDFKGHPDLRRLLLPDDWPKGVYPLRRDYQEWDKSAIRDRGVPEDKS